MSSLPKIPPRAGLTLISSESDDNTPTYTVEDALDYIGLGTFQYVVLLLAGLGWTAESMEMLLLSFIKQPLQCNWDISDSQAALITTFVAAGMFAGSTSWGIFADQYGRRTAFFVCTLFLFFMGILSAFSVNYTMMLIARGLVGFGVGGIPIAFSLLMEFLPNAQRGSWGMSLAIFWSIGAVFESLVAMYVLPKFGWRWLIIFSTIPLLLVLLFSFWLSESPRWLSTRGRQEDVERILARISRINGRPLPPGRLTIVPSIINSTSQDVENGDNNASDNQHPAPDADPFTPSDSLISAQVSPTSASDYAGSADIASDVATAPSPVANDPEEGEEEEPLDEGWTESASPSPSRKKNVMADLLRPGARQLAITLAFSWFIVSFVYYGLIMLQPELISAENYGTRCSYTADECAVVSKPEVCRDEPLCSWLTNDNPANGINCVPSGTTQAHESVDGSVPENSACARKLTREDYISTLWASVGEMPGVMIAFVVVDIIGRRPMIGYYFLVLFGVHVLLNWCTSRLVETTNFFIGRGAACGAFQALFLYTNEVYPSSIRATAMGLASSTARAGILVTPFVAQYILNFDETAALAIYSVLSLIAFGCIVLLPIEPTGRPLVSSMEELVQSLREARLRGMTSARRSPMTLQ